MLMITKDLQAPASVHAKPGFPVFVVKCGIQFFITLHSWARPSNWQYSNKYNSYIWLHFGICLLAFCSALSVFSSCTTAATLGELPWITVLAKKKFYWLA